MGSASAAVSAAEVSVEVTFAAFAFAAEVAAESASVEAAAAVTVSAVVAAVAEVFAAAVSAEVAHVFEERLAEFFAAVAERLVLSAAPTVAVPQALDADGALSRPDIPSDVRTPVRAFCYPLITPPQKLIILNIFTLSPLS